jgi:hypothetical protein
MSISARRWCKSMNFMGSPPFEAAGVLKENVRPSVSKRALKRAPSAFMTSK